MQNITKLTKIELVELEGKLLAEEKIRNRELREIQTKIRKIKDAEKKVRHIIYECADCTDAKYTNKVDKWGDEYNSFINDCGKEKCTYQAHFKKQILGSIKQP